MSGAAAEEEVCEATIGEDRSGGETGGARHEIGGGRSHNGEGGWTELQ